MRGQLNTQLSFDISHSVDDSDIAFVMRLDRGSSVCTLLGEKSAFRQRLGTTVDPFINLCTLNYLLAGLQTCMKHTRPSKWTELLVALDKERFGELRRELCFSDIRHIVRNLITPFGIVRGSERQGGQDEVGLSPATWPVNFVANLVIDGKERNVVNVWHYHDIDAGDDLVLRLKPMPLPGKEGYTLNHYYKSVARHDFEGLPEVLAKKFTHVWQLVPDIFSLEAVKENCSRSGVPECKGVVMPTDALRVPQDYNWQSFGYWHIGRSQVRFRKYGLQEYYNNDMANLLKTNHMDMTFQPSWHKCPGEPQSGPGAAYIPGDTTHPALTAPNRVAPGLFGDYATAGSWGPTLRLETVVYPFADPPPVPALSSSILSTQDEPDEPARRKTGLLAAFSEAFEQRLGGAVGAMPELPASAGVDLLAEPPSGGADVDMLPPTGTGVKKQTKKKPAGGA